MVEKKSKGILRVEFLDNHSDQMLLANYLRSTGDAKGAVFDATKRSLYALALAKQGTSSKPELEMALSLAVSGLEVQIKYITEHFRIFEGIELPSEPSTRSSMPLVPLPSISTFSREYEDEDDEDDEDEDEPVCLTLANDNVSLNF